MQIAPIAAFVAFARSMFEKEAALRRSESHQRRLLLDQISAQLRTQLEAVEGHRGSGASRSDRPALAMDPSNGK